MTCVEPIAMPCTKTVPTLVVVTLLNVSVVVPATVAELLTTAIAPEATVTVTLIGLGGVAARLMLTLCCRSRPAVTLPIEIAGAVTVAVITRCEAIGVSNPAGTPTVISVVPADAGSNAVSLKLSPPLNITGLTVIVPDVQVMSDVTGTSTVIRHAAPGTPPH